MSTRTTPDVCASCPVHTGECPRCGTFWFIRGTKRYGVEVVEKAMPVLAPAIINGRHTWIATAFEDLPNVQVHELRGTA